MVYGINHYSIPYSNQISFCLKMKLVLFSIIPFISITQSSAQRGGHNSGRVCDDKSSAMLACYQDLASKDSCVKCYTSESWSCGSISSSVLDINQKCVNAGKCASDCSAYGKAFLQCLMEYQCGWQLISRNELTVIIHLRCHLPGVLTRQLAFTTEMMDWLKEGLLIYSVLLEFLIKLNIFIVDGRHTLFWVSDSKVTYYYPSPPRRYVQKIHAAS